MNRRCSGVRVLADERDAMTLHAHRPGDHSEPQALGLEHRALLDVQLGIGPDAGDDGTGLEDVVEADTFGCDDVGQCVARLVLQRAYVLDLERSGDSG